MVGFRNEDEKDLIDCDSPFKFYDRLRESQIFRFLKLIGCTNHQVGEFAKFVKRRHKIAHPTGTVFFNDQTQIDAEIAEMMREVRNIEAHMQPVIEEIYARFLLESQDEETRQYADDKDEISVNLVHRNYMSRADLAFCRTFSIAGMNTKPEFASIEALHASLLELYPKDETEAA